MMNKMMKKVAMVFAAATMAIAGSSMIVSANDGMGIDALTPDVTVQDMSSEGIVMSLVGARVRTAPTDEAKIVDTLKFGEKVEISGKTSNDWYQVITTDPVYGGTGTHYIYGGLLGDTKLAAPKQESSIEIKAEDVSYIEDMYLGDGTQVHLFAMKD